MCVWYVSVGTCIPWHMYGYQRITFRGWFSFTVGSRAQIQVFRVVWQVLSAEPSHWPGSSISYWYWDYRHAPPHLGTEPGLGSCETIVSPSQLAPSGPIFFFFLLQASPFAVTPYGLSCGLFLAASSGLEDSQCSRWATFPLPFHPI